MLTHGCAIHIIPSAGIWRTCTHHLAGAAAAGRSRRRVLLGRLGVSLRLLKMISRNVLAVSLRIIQWLHESINHAAR